MNLTSTMYSLLTYAMPGLIAMAPAEQRLLLFGFSVIALTLPIVALAWPRRAPARHKETEHKEPRHKAGME